MAVPLMSAEVPKGSVKEYLMFFRHCTKRSAAQWQDCRCSVNKINNSVDALYPSSEPNSCSSGEFDAWWKARFVGLLDASTAVKTLFETWEARTVLAEPEAKKFIVQMVKGINAQVIEDPSMTSNLGRQSVQAGEVVVTSVIAAGDLELPFGDQEDDPETLAEVSVETTPSARKNKRKEVTQAQDSVVQPDPLAENSHPPSKPKKLRKKAVEEQEESAVVPAETTETDEELRDAFEAVEQEKEKDILEGEKEKRKTGEEERALSWRRNSKRLKEQSLLVQNWLFSMMWRFLPPFLFQVEEDRTTGTLVVVTSSLKPPIVAVSVNVPLALFTTSFADP
ncbi:unnamed protein product [Prunus brigantina]